MREHLARYGVHVELSKGLIDIHQKGDHVIASIARCENGQPTADREDVACSYLVGADGARGVTRKLLKLSFAGETRDTDGQVWGDVEIDGLDDQVLNRTPTGYSTR